MLADPVLAGVHHRGDLRGVGAAFGVGEGGDLRGPQARGERDQGTGPVAEAGVDHAGRVAGSGQVPLGDRVGQGLPGVQAGQLGGAHGPPQPPGLVAWFGAVAGRQAGQEQVPVALLAGGGGFGGPDGVQDGQVIGVGQGAAPVLGGGAELAVSFQDGAEHGQRFAGRGGRGGRGGDAGSSGLDLVVAVQLGCGPGAGGGVGALGGHGEHVRQVDTGAAGQGDQGVRAVLGAGDHGQAGGHGAALRDVAGDRVAQLGMGVAGVQEVPGGPAALPGLRGRRPARGARSARRR